MHTKLSCTHPHSNTHRIPPHTSHTHTHTHMNTHANYTHHTHTHTTHTPTHSGLSVGAYIVCVLSITGFGSAVLYQKHFWVLYIPTALIGWESTCTFRQSFFRACNY